MMQTKNGVLLPNLNNSTGVSYCCHRCFVETGGLWLDRMILCACGCKRCPKASDHRHDCTGSNERGQPGSVYR